MTAPAVAMRLTTLDGAKTCVVAKLSRKSKKGLHPDAHVIKVKNRKYVRDNPDRSKSDNVNR